MAASARDAYQKLRQEDTSDYRLHPSIDNTAYWQRIAEFCKAENVIPATFIRVVYRAMYTKNIPPLPSMLSGNKGREIFNTYQELTRANHNVSTGAESERRRPVAELEAESELATALKILEDARMQRGAADKSTLLLSHLTPFSPWLRCMLADVGASYTAEVDEVWGRRALAELQADPVKAAYFGRIGFQIQAITQRIMRNAR
jgi:hypothetical protein